MPQTNDDLEALLAFSNDKVSTSINYKYKNKFRKPFCCCKLSKHQDFSQSTVTKLQIPKTSDNNDFEAVLAFTADQISTSKIN